MVCSGWLEHASLGVTGHKVQAAAGFELEGIGSSNVLQLSIHGLLAGLLLVAQKQKL
jgi:hypothetical protein